MYALESRNGVTEAYMEKNRIVAADSLQLMGILLGNCVFDCAGKMAGKFLDNTFYNVKGEIVVKGKVVPPVHEVEELLNQHQQEGAVVLTSITNHTDIWIEISGLWSKHTLADTLRVMSLA
ncbi:hypothetical protein HNQ91_001195 [Filimonas zeae]|uniref:Uncharacterized protein n=1 Tax=Filimonas zeae TaxID=1737353 RepID=A0A917IUF4_9BACT|nr:hypothetical protein [Filimonas zeae]MDR6338173.1 hypothetical protein [Filimonas zeae]GGH62080.1 hypothetical protein GCM10011379_11690 [Filimonas zeae]